MQKIILFLFLFLPGTQLLSQTPVKGRVTDVKKQPLSFVSVVVLQNNKRLASTATDDSGRFELPLQAGVEGDCIMRFSQIGYQSFSKTVIKSDTSFIDIILSPDQQSLAAVTVYANRPVVTRKADRSIINVENSFLANGNSGLEVLQRSPGLWVDNNGGIKIRGTQSVTVMINDIVQRMSSEELSEYLRTLKSEDISKIEIIPNPPAEYEAAGSGGIVHIILKKARKDGLNGYLSGQYRLQGREPFWAGAGNIDFKAGRLYMFGGFSLVNDINNSFGNSKSAFADNSTFSSVGTRHNENVRQQYRAGLSYEISKTQTFTFQHISAVTQMHHTFRNDITEQNGPVILSGLNETDWLRKPLQQSSNILYTIKTDSLGSVIKFIADYTHSSREEVNVFSATYNDHTQDITHVNTTPNNTSLYTLQLDHTKVYGKNWTLRTGIKYSGIERDNQVTIEDIINGSRTINTAASNHFIYHEQLLMGYSAVEKMMGATSVKLGLRAEQTVSEGNSITSNLQFSRKYLGLFPSLFITRSLNENKGNSLSFSFSRRLERPGFNELNPYRLQLSSVSTIVGNPDLQPQYSYNYELGYQFMKGWSATLYYTKTTNVIAQLSNPVGNAFEVKYENLDKNTSYGLSFDAPVTVTKNWTIINGLSLYHSDYTIRSFQNSNTVIALKHIHSLILKKFVDIDVIAEYTSPRVNANERVSDFFYMDIGFSKKIVKGKMRARLYFSDIFNLSREAAVTDYLGAHTEFYQKRQTQNIALSLSYNFSMGKKFSNKKIEQMNSDEKRRMGN